MLSGVDAARGARTASRDQPDAIDFLLKWNAEIHRENQFNMMQALREVHIVEALRTDEQVARWERIQRSIGSGSWKLFRAKRKLKHLLG